MQSKSKSHSNSWISDSWIISTAFHGLLATFAFLILFTSTFQKKNDIVIEIVEMPKLATQPIQLTTPKAPPKKARGHEVYGMTRKTLTSEQGEQVKLGNTLAKTPDLEKLRPQDPDSLPIPSEEYLITKMPELKTEVRVHYPPESKKNGIQGAVIMDLLIDSSGKVREVALVEGPNPELSKAAITAAHDFQFTPALIEEKPVAVRIRYAYRFVLER